MIALVLLFAVVVLLNLDRLHAGSDEYIPRIDGEW